VREGNAATVRVGITDYAAEALGDIVYVSLPTVGQDVAAGDACGELESTKSVSEVFSPVDGVVSAVNDHLTDTPETVNSGSVRRGLAVRDRALRGCRSRRPPGLRRVRRARRRLTIPAALRHAPSLSTGSGGVS